MTPARIENLGSDLRRMGRRIASVMPTGTRGRASSARHASGARERAPVAQSGIGIPDIMERDLATVFPGSPLRYAVRVMIENRISSVPVVDVEGRIVGALNEGDLMQVFYEPGVHCVADVMTRDPIVLPVDAPFVDVVDELMSSNFRRVLIHENGRLVGVITRSHVMPALLAALERRSDPPEMH